MWGDFMKYGIFYGTTSYTTEDVANKLAKKIPNVEVYNVADGIDEMQNCDFIFILTPTYGRGEIEENWEFVIDDLLNIDFTNKTVAIIGTGDYVEHPTSFVNTIKTMHDILEKTDAKIVGYTNADGYTFEESTAFVNGKFLGLPIDEINEEDKTDERLNRWLEGIL